MGLLKKYHDFKTDPLLADYTRRGVASLLKGFMRCSSVLKSENYFLNQQKSTDYLNNICIIPTKVQLLC